MAEMGFCRQKPNLACSELYENCNCISQLLLIKAALQLLSLHSSLVHIFPSFGHTQKRFYASALLPRLSLFKRCVACLAMLMHASYAVLVSCVCALYRKRGEISSFSTLKGFLRPHVSFVLCRLCLLPCDAMRKHGLCCRPVSIYSC